MRAFLLLGGYVLFVGCNGDKGELLPECEASDLAVSVISSVKSDCDRPGSIIVAAEGGEKPYMFSLDGVTYQPDSTFSNLAAGNYSIRVMDALGCTASVDFNLESEPTGIILNLSSTKTICGEASGSIEASASGGTGTFMYSLNGSGFSASGSFVNLPQGTYEVVVKDEENCLVTREISIVTTTRLETDIMPIIQKDCAISGCHNGSRSPRLTTPQEVIQNATRIKSETQAGSMPRNRTLSQREIDLIACWVDDGAPNN